MSGRQGTKMNEWLPYFRKMGKMELVKLRLVIGLLRWSGIKELAKGGYFLLCLRIVQNRRESTCWKRNLSKQVAKCKMNNTNKERKLEQKLH